MIPKYDNELDLSVRNNSHTLTVELVGCNKEVLEIGPATGYVSKALVDRGCRVTGIEIDAEAAKKAADVCDRLIVGNVEDLNLDEALEGESFDVILCGDVLEHLKDPLDALRRLKSFLRPEGYVVASLPNIAHGSVRLALMQGKFPYAPLGLLDETHLRFFTRESVEKLFNDTGFLIDVLERTVRDILDSEVQFDREAVPEEILDLVRQDPESRTYQFVLKASPSNDTETVVELRNRNRLLLDQLARRDRLVYELNQDLRGLDDTRYLLDRRNKELAAKEEETSLLKQRISDLNGQLNKNEKLRQRLNNRLERALSGRE